MDFPISDHIHESIPGDSNHDGIFNSKDLIQVFQIGEYEDAIENNSTFADGDWNGDGEFDSADLVLAFQSGNYSRTASAVDLAIQLQFADREADDELRDLVKRQRNTMLKQAIL